jgi:broad specificity phosphatase PhoE
MNFDGDCRVLALGLMGGVAAHWLMCHFNKVESPEQSLLSDDLNRKSEEAVLRPTRKTLRLFLIRHGESKMNLQPGLVCGRSNPTPLSAKGRHQSTALGERFKRSNIVFDATYTSTAARAIDTAVLAAEHGCSGGRQLIHTPALLELSMGGFVGQPRQAVYTDDVMAKIEADSINFRPTGCEPDGTPGESQYECEQRVWKFIHEKILANSKDEPSGEEPKVACFMHGLAIRCFLRAVLGASTVAAMHMEHANTAITEVGEKCMVASSVWQH